MKLPEELKEAISNLPSKEKDKLIFRLLKKDLMLANQLLFNLVSTDSVEEKREQTKAQLAKEIQHATEKFYSSGYLLLDVRTMSGIITEHAKITKDKFGEAYLNLWMLNEVIEKNKEHILSDSYGKSETFCVAAIARAFKIMLLIKKLHEDFLIEFEDELKRLGELISDNKHLMRRAINHGLDVNWLINVNIPENLEQIYKDIRAQGFLT